jgi:diaminopimelate epimerase
MQPVPFIKMHGLGNDFVVVDARQRPWRPSPGVARRIADRRVGVGCDQILIIEPSQRGQGSAFLRIFNSNGSEVGACGNGTRCVARLLLDAQPDAHEVVIETAAGALTCLAAAGGEISVDMGPVRRDWRDIPLAEPVDPMHLPVRAGPLCDGVAVNVGNPHAVFIVDNADAIDLAAFGPVIETAPLFPEGTNVEVVSVLAPDRLRLRVWERGVGITRACGTGACAGLAAAHHRGLAAAAADVLLDGGTLHIALSDGGRVRMTGPAAISFRGELPAAMLTD